MKLHASGEDYLETILVLQKKLGMVRSVDVARHMEVSKPSVCYSVGTLRGGGFLTLDDKHYLHLTELGRDAAEKSLRTPLLFNKVPHIHRCCPCNGGGRCLSDRTRY